MPDPIPNRTIALACALALAGSGCVPAAMSGRGADGASAAVSESVPSHLVARGTEPFWAVEVDSGRLVWRTPEQPEGVAVAVERRTEGGRVLYVARDDAGMALEVVPGRCSDGMSDLVYPFTATWTRAGRAWRGCALPPD